MGGDTYADTPLRRPYGDQPAGPCTTRTPGFPSIVTISTRASYPLRRNALNPASAWFLNRSAWGAPSQTVSQTRAGPSGVRYTR